MRPQAKPNDWLRRQNQAQDSPEDPQAASYEVEEDVANESSSDLSGFIVSDNSILSSDDEESPVFGIKTPRRRLVRGRRPTEPSSPVEEFLKSSTQCPSPDMIPHVADLLSNLSFSSPQPRLPNKLTTTPLKIFPHTTPKKSKSSLSSPPKKIRILTTPHRPSMDSFWSQAVINDWNDANSPPKSLMLKNKPGVRIGSPIKSLSKIHMETKSSNKDRVKNGGVNPFAELKHDLAEDFLKELDNKVTGGQLCEMTTSTGGVKILWSKKLCTTAGRANWKKETIRTQSLGAAQILTYRHYASIELAEKVIDDKNRLFNVLAHEFCHLANFMISGIRNNPHGKEFKLWAVKCSQLFGIHGVEVTTKHSYEIDYRYIWQCTSCGLHLKRHSKSIDPSRHRCGLCESRLVQIKPVPRDGGTVSDYQRFLKENMTKTKEENPTSPQKEIMRIVARKYREQKASRKTDQDTGVVDDVVERLEFLDLT